MTLIQHAPIADISTLARVVDEIWQRGDLDTIDHLYDRDFLGHDPQLIVPLSGRKDLRRHISACRTAFPDLRVAIEDVVIAADRLACRYTARATHLGPLRELPATGQRVTVTGIGLIRFGRDGRIAEQWSCTDTLRLIRQLRVAR